MLGICTTCFLFIGRKTCKFFEFAEVQNTISHKQKVEPPGLAKFSAENLSAVTSAALTVHRTVIHYHFGRSLRSLPPSYSPFGLITLRSQGLSHARQPTKKGHLSMSFSLVAGRGFEPPDLRVMSPTSYRAALPRDIKLVWHTKWCRRPVSNRYATFVARDFKSRASANSATPAFLTIARKSPTRFVHYIISPKCMFVNPFLKKSVNYLSTNCTF